MRPTRGCASARPSLTAAGATFTGVNVENASYPVGLCAERAALAAAVTAGERRFAALAVATASGAPILPCGACLQAFAEFGEIDGRGAVAGGRRRDSADRLPASSSSCVSSRSATCCARRFGWRATRRERAAVPLGLRGGAGPPQRRQVDAGQPARGAQGEHRVGPSADHAAAHQRGRHRRDFQLVLLDLPGFQRPFDSLTRRMQATVDATLAEVDAALFMLNAAEAPGGGDRYIARAVASARTPYVAVLNKVDAVTRDVLAARRAAAEELLDGGEVRPISALRGDGLAEVVAALVAAMPEGPVYFPEGEVSDQPLELLVAELIREQALRVTREEVPHAVAVQIESITERPGDSLVEIEAYLIVEHESQKAILIGKGGSVVKRIGSGARGEIETVLGARVFLVAARQGAQALAARRPVRRPPALTAGAIRPGAGEPGRAAAGRGPHAVAIRHRPPRAALIYSGRMAGAAGAPESTEGAAARCTLKNLPRRSTTPCCSPTPRAATSSGCVEQAAEYHFAAVCVLPHWVRLCGRLLVRLRRQGLHGGRLSVRRRRHALQGRGRRRGGGPRRRRDRRRDVPAGDALRRLHLRARRAHRGGARGAHGAASTTAAVSSSSRSSSRPATCPTSSRRWPAASSKTPAPIS